MLPFDKMYMAIKDVIPNDYDVKFSYVNLSNIDNERTSVLEDTVGIYFRTANNADRVLSGDYVVEYVRLIFNVYTHRGESGVLDGLDYCRRVCEILDKVFNRTFNIDGYCFTILDARRLGTYQYLGPTKQGIQTFSINYLIKYEGGN